MFYQSINIKKDCAISRLHIYKLKFGWSKYARKITEFQVPHAIYDLKTCHSLPLPILTSKYHTYGPYYLYQGGIKFSGCPFYDSHKEP